MSKTNNFYLASEKLQHFTSSIKSLQKSTSRKHFGNFSLHKKIYSICIFYTKSFQQPIHTSAPFSLFPECRDQIQPKGGKSNNILQRFQTSEVCKKRLNCLAVEEQKPTKGRSGLFHGVKGEPQVFSGFFAFFLLLCPATLARAQHSDAPL